MVATGRILNILHLEPAWEHSAGRASQMYRGKLRGEFPFAFPTIASVARAPHLEALSETFAVAEHLIRFAIDRRFSSCSRFRLQTVVHWDRRSSAGVLGNRRASCSSQLGPAFPATPNRKLPGFSVSFGRSRRYRPGGPGPALALQEAPSQLERSQQPQPALFLIISRVLLSTVDPDPGGLGRF